MCRAATHACFVCVRACVCVQIASVLECVTTAMEGPGLEPFVPLELTPAAYAARIAELFGEQESPDLFG